MKNYEPSFTLTTKIIKLSESIAYEMGRLVGEKYFGSPHNDNEGVVLMMIL
jgi:hypothetical protein